MNWGIKGWVIVVVVVRVRNVVSSGSDSLGSHCSTSTIRICRKLINILFRFSLRHDDAQHLCALSSSNPKVGSIWLVLIVSGPSSVVSGSLSVIGVIVSGKAHFFAFPPGVCLASNGCEMSPQMSSGWSSDKEKRR